MSRITRNKYVIQKLLEDPEPESGECFDDEDDSNDEVEGIENEEDFSSESEQEADDCSEKNPTGRLRQEDFFIGKGANVPKSLKKTQKGKTKNAALFDAVDDSFKWKKTPYTCKTKTKQRNIVNIRPGPTRSSRDITDESSAFFKMIDHDMIADIVRFTNLRIARLQLSESYGRERDCRETSETELLSLFGVLYLIGIHHGNHANVSELWNSDGTGMILLRSVMSYKRFYFLLRHLRFDDPDTRELRRETDKLAAIRPVLDPFLENCKNSYTMSEAMTIDEMLHPFRGRCSFIQYIPSKPVKYGLKIFACSDSYTFYTGTFEVYCGQQADGPYKVSNSPADIVKRLVKPYENKNRNLTTDNWYTSHPLAQELLQKKITLLGTMKKNKREIPAEFLPSKEKEVGTSQFGFQKDTTLVSYVPRRNRSVVLLSTMHDLPEIDAYTEKPVIITDYNALKGAVDTVGKMCATYSVSRVTRRWPLALFFVFLNIAGINAQVLYLSVKAESTRRIAFIKNLALSLMKPQLALRSSMVRLPIDIKQFLKKEELVELEPVRVTAHLNVTKGRCKQCKNSSTTLRCDKCSEFVCKKHAISSVQCPPCADGASVCDST